MTGEAAPIQKREYGKAEKMKKVKGNRGSIGDTHMIVKKFVPCIYLYNGHAVRTLTDFSVVETDTCRLVHLYN